MIKQEIVSISFTSDKKDVMRHGATKNFDLISSLLHTHTMWLKITGHSFQWLTISFLDEKSTTAWFDRFFVQISIVSAFNVNSNVQFLGIIILSYVPNISRRIKIKPAFIISYLQIGRWCWIQYSNACCAIFFFGRRCCYCETRLFFSNAYINTQHPEK